MLFVVAMGVIIFAVNSSSDKKLTALVLCPFMAISYGFVRVFNYIFKEKYTPVHDDSIKDGKRLIKAMFPIVLTIFLMAFILINSGLNIANGRNYKVSKNDMHMPEGITEAMDYLIERAHLEGIEDGIRVIPQPGYEQYYLMYSTKFDLYFDMPKGDDFLYYTKWQQAAYTQLSDDHPSMKEVSDAAHHDNIDYVVIKDGSLWSEFPLDSFDFEDLGVVGGYRIYHILPRGGDS